MNKSVKMLTSLLVLFVLGTGAALPLTLEEDRIIGGHNSDIRHYPYIISLRDASGKHTCGGTIISAHWIVTAGHCVYGKATNAYSVQYGLTDVTPIRTNVLPVKRVIVHEQFVSWYPYVNDIAMIELATSLPLNGVTVAPVKLPPINFEVKQTNGEVPVRLAGWGRNGTQGELQTKLQELTMQTYSDLECYKLHGAITNKHQLCAGIEDGGKGQCSGDSGGPLIYGDNILLGIVSWSIKPCAKPPYPGVYTKVSHYVDWIHSQVNLN